MICIFITRKFINNKTDTVKFIIFIIIYLITSTSK